MDRWSSILFADPRAFASGRGLFGLRFLRFLFAAEKAVSGEYYALLLLTVSGMLILVMASDFRHPFRRFATHVPFSYGVVGLFEGPRNPWRFPEIFLTGVFASAFLLYGVAYLYGATGSIQFPGFPSLYGGGRPGLLFVKLGVAWRFNRLRVQDRLCSVRQLGPDVYDGRRRR